MYGRRRYSKGYSSRSSGYRSRTGTRRTYKKVGRRFIRKPKFAVTGYAKDTERKYFDRSFHGRGDDTLVGLKPVGGVVDINNGITWKSTINEITNVGAISVEIKGGTTILEAETMWFASNQHPTKIIGCSHTDGRYEALRRRFIEVYWWRSANKDDCTILENPGLAPENADEEAMYAWEDKCREWEHFWNGNQTPAVAGFQTTPGGAEVNEFDW